MARRSGIVHGIGVFVLSLVVGLLVGSMASMTDGVDVAENLRSIGVPTDWDQVESVGVAAAIASIAAILLGSLIGGTLGERWHTKLANRFEDPAYGPASEARARAEREARAHAERRNADPLVRHDAAVLDQTPDRADDADRTRAADVPVYRDAGTLDRSALPIDDPRVETIDLRREPPAAVEPPSTDQDAELGRTPGRHAR